MYCPYCGKVVTPQLDWASHVVVCTSRAPTDPAPTQLSVLAMGAASQAGGVEEVMELELEEGDSESTVPNLDLDDVAVRTSAARVLDVHSAASASGPRGWLEAPEDDDQELSLELDSQDATSGWRSPEYDGPYADAFKRFQDMVSRVGEQQFRENLARLLQLLQRFGSDVRSHAPDGADGTAALSSILNVATYFMVAAQGHQDMQNFLSRLPRARVEARLKEMAQGTPNAALLAATQKKLTEVAEAERRIRVAVQVVTNGEEAVRTAAERLDMIVSSIKGPEARRRVTTLARQLEAVVCVSAV